MYSFNTEEIKKIESRGSSVLDVRNQLEIFERGFQFMKLVKPATIGDGIISITQEQLSEFIEKYDTQKRYYSILKFIPASGAASRMFKHLFAFLSDKRISKEVTQFINNIDSLAFYKDFEGLVNDQVNELVLQKNYTPILEAILKQQGLNYGESPKGLIPFHSLNGQSRTAFQEHFVEGIEYASNGQNGVKLHFTISESHQNSFKEHLNDFLQDFERLFETKFEVTFSYQKKSTDTIAVDSENKPINIGNNQFLFRPGGHGSLIQNLAELDADIIFIKNIDNVLPDNLKTDTTKYKKALAAKLIDVQTQVFHYLEKLAAQPKNLSLLSEVTKFCKIHLNINLDEGFQQLKPPKQHSILVRLLNRPLRVCGMVKNTGEPGGGPFWVENSDGTTTLQIVESAQVNIEDPVQKEVLMKSTHFNPVDIVCSTKNYLGENFDLMQFIDQDTYFISEKTFKGRAIKALEHPGLWNGAMSNWLTVFVEVPISTFSPVKSVNDLLKEEHQWR